MSIAMWNRLEELERGLEQLRHDIATLFEKVERVERQRETPAKVRRVG